ncbi:hypothetical protein GCWU000325_02207 [Alloprevotella tannerae ATCC 51259]|uniref:Uncharacterized protein n=1 Tax=Alloprevotella tannerae ATCC 51259 TaxID=626522 RepID=C9LIZ6_9BACT|nr:hypothetical protein GCWU000325_02207 [Alloprevotella tannerae ATCC 51259]
MTSLFAKFSKACRVLFLTHPRLRAADAFFLFLRQKAQKKSDFKRKSDFV